MAKKIHLRLIGQAEKFIDDMVEQGLTDRDVIAKALWLFETAWKTQRIALLNADCQEVEYIFTSKKMVDTALTSIKLNQTGIGAMMEVEVSRPKQPLTKEEEQLRKIFGESARAKKSSKTDLTPEAEEGRGHETT